MVQDGTPVGDAWQAELNQAGAVLKQFQRAGIPVLFRPLHEQNGDFFWWGYDHSSGAALAARQAAWVAVWRDMVTDLVVRQGIKNLLFIYGVNQMNYSDETAPLTFYPGMQWADAVGIDIYQERLNLAGGQRGLQHYTALVGTGKVFGIAEFGQNTFDNGTGPNSHDWDARTLARRVRDSYPRTAFAIAWYSSVEGGGQYIYALADVAHTRELLNDPLIQTQ
jgi:mannan endo-1,4-beta-mannosidase